ncbi:unnamed protein product [Mytilus edulis]|uniref:Uncharacterized protein n=1 Tax=Mytilus edulis TaxID=6550 RepID=A0A8S3VHK4_MYTED|nr:unnamed protein product [Mytilus edulis]
MLSKIDAIFLKKGLSTSNEAKGKNPRKGKASGDDSRAKNADTSSSSGARFSVLARQELLLYDQKILVKILAELAKSPLKLMFFSPEKYTARTEFTKPDFVSLKSMLILMVAKPPAKRQTTVDKECDNVFRAAAQAYRSKDNVDTSVDDTLADTVNEFFREGISDEKYNELMKSVARPENCVSLTRTRVNQLIWD